MTYKYPGPAPRKQISVRLDTETIEYLDREALLLSTRPPYHDISASDIVRYALREYRARHAPTEPLAARPKCDVVETAGGAFCTFCGARSTEPNTDPQCRLTTGDQ
jgi:hypothetical protein